jgi:hypothetical protein
MVQCTRGAAKSLGRARRKPSAKSDFYFHKIKVLKMTRPRTPTSILEARGAFDKNPNRRRESEPKAEGEIGNPPVRFSVAEIAAWDEIVSCCASGVLCKSDRIAVEIAAVLLAAFRSDPMGLPAAKVARLDSLLSRFGMTPSDRSKVTVPPPFKENPFLALIGKRTD